MKGSWSNRYAIFIFKTYFMKKIYFLLLLINTWAIAVAQENNKNEIFIGNLSGKSAVTLIKSSQGQWGLSIGNPYLSAAHHPKPVQVELYKDSSNIQKNLPDIKVLSNRLMVFRERQSFQLKIFLLKLQTNGQSLTATCT